MNVPKIVGLFLLLCIVVACQSSRIASLPAFSPSGNVFCVVEIPAGTNKKIEYNKTTKTFEVDQRNGQDRVIDFLPYPGNYGFIPSTYSDPEKGGDGDALDILVLCESLKTGTVLEVIPLGILKLIDDGETDYKIIAIPADEGLRTISARSFAELSRKYPSLTGMIETWFLNYDSDPATVESWGDEEAAKKEIQKEMRPAVGRQTYP